MKRKMLSQESLKLIACVTMLIDHIGAVFVPGYSLRIIGRIAFPIYCFLLAEGVVHTRDRWKYGIRLLIGMILAEIPFDLLFFGKLTWAHQSVMVTLFLGFLMLEWKVKRSRKWLPICICFFAAEILGTDYGGWGILLIALLASTEDKRHGTWLRILGMAVIFGSMNSFRVPFLGLQIPLQMFGVLAMIPIGLYSGEKRSNSRAVQLAFYAFYPVHLLILWLIAGR